MWRDAIYAFVLVLTGVAFWFIFIYTAKKPKEHYSTIEKDRVLEEADTGDLIFLSGNTYGERLIKRLTNSAYSHIGFVLKVSGAPYVWEADLGQGYRDGPRLIPLKKKLKRWKGDTIGGWKRVTGVRPDEKKVIEVIESLVSKGMDHKMTKWLASGYPTSRVYSYLSDDSKIYCSELVAMTLISLGLLGKGKHPSWYSPQSFVDDSVVTFYLQ